MPNVLLTQKCVRSCPYCFAKKHMSESTPDDILLWENLIYLADFFELSGERNISLLGGEPTLHPNFLDFVIYLLERNFNVRVFTSGIMSERVLEGVALAVNNVPPERLSFICNLNDPKRTHAPFAEIERVKRFLTVFGSRTVAGFNIYQTDFELDFLFKYINNYGLRRTIRLGIAHPIPGKQNIYIFLDDIPSIINRLFSYRELFERCRVKPGLDCGFPMCKLSNTQLGWLYQFTGGASSFGCGPAIDIGPDMSVWSCFPLSSFHKKSIFEFDTLQDVIRFYQRMIGLIRMEVGGIYEECDNCVYREDGICSGGCVAHILSYFQNEARVRVPEVYL
jgi:radical SAM protein with 4Fe4S-binding SPASM domain